MFVLKIMRFLVSITIILILLTLVVNSKPSSLKHDSGRIINGHDVPEGKFPFMASIHSMEVPCDFSKSNGPGCGGAVINDNTILTAAHCLGGNFDINKTAILVGGHHLEKMGGCYNISKLIPHPEYKNVGKTPDVGVIKLTSRIDFKKDKASKICLPEPLTKAVSTECTIMGWGATGGDGKKHLQEFDVTARKTSEFGTKDGHYKVDFGESGSSTCYGDSGGPLVCLAESKDLLQFGIVSFGAGGDCKGYSGYTNVALYIDWIRKVAED